MSKLYQLTQEILALQNAAYDATDEEFEALKAQFSEAKIALSEKLDSCGKLLLEWDAEIDAIDNELERLKNRKNRTIRRSDWLQSYIGNCLGEGTPYKTPLFSFSWRKSTSVEITGDVPEQYLRTKVVSEPDKKAIGDDLKAGASFDFARLVEKQSLQIK